MGSVGEGEYGGYCITGDADEFFGEADVPIEECGPHVPRLAEVLCKMTRSDVANNAAGALYRFVRRLDVG